MLGWSRRQESNLYLALRRHSFYPLNYGETLELGTAFRGKPKL
jgi:hypothetical protein